MYRHLKIGQMWTTGDLQRKISSIPYRNAGKSIKHFQVFKAVQPRDLIDYQNHCAHLKSEQILLCALKLLLLLEFMPRGKINVS